MEEPRKSEHRVFVLNSDQFEVTEEGRLIVTGIDLTSVAKDIKPEGESPEAGGVVISVNVGGG